MTGHEKGEGGEAGENSFNDIKPNRDAAPAAYFTTRLCFSKDRENV